MKTADMTKGSPAKLLLQFAIPILIGNLFQQAYTLTDRIIVGRFVGYRGNKCVVNDVYVHVYGCGNGYLYGTEYRSR